VVSIRSLTPAILAHGRLATVHELVIGRRFRGPARSANGGYASGTLAGALGPGTHQVTLRVPPPLEVPLRVEVDDRTAVLHHGETLVAEAEAVEEEIDPVEPVPFDEAVAASTAYPGLRAHPFPTCFSCGTDRPDGLRIFPGPVAPAPGGATRVAAPWTPSPDVDLATAWAALDCIGGWAGDLGDRLMVLGRMTACVDAVPAAGEPHVVMGQAARAEGRRTWTASTLYDPDGRIVGRAAHVWVAVDPAAFN
jgi:hypothetical protein